jgi:hypothetical protein
MPPLRSWSIERKNYSEIDAGFAKLIEGVSEDEAGYRPLHSWA